MRIPGSTDNCLHMRQFQRHAPRAFLCHQRERETPTERSSEIGRIFAGNNGGVGMLTSSSTKEGCGWSDTWFPRQLQVLQTEAQSDLPRVLSVTSVADGHDVELPCNTTRSVFSPALRMVVTGRRSQRCLSQKVLTHPTARTPFPRCTCGQEPGHAESDLKRSP